MFFCPLYLWSFSVEFPICTVFALHCEFRIAGQVAEYHIGIFAPFCHMLMRGFVIHVQEKQMLADQYKQQEVLWQKQSHRLTEIVKNNEGVWLLAKLFYIVGSLSLLSIITIVLEIAFYVYFHWIL